MTDNHTPWRVVGTEVFYVCAEPDHPSYGRKIAVCDTAYEADQIVREHNIFPVLVEAAQGIIKADSGDIGSPTSGSQAETAAIKARVAALAAENAKQRRIVDTTVLWCWRPSDVLTDSERLSAIKYHPYVKALANQKPANPDDNASCCSSETDKARIAELEVPTWDVCKIAFASEAEDEDAVWDAFSKPDNGLPDGWTLKETYCSGVCPPVAIFDVAGIPSLADAAKVRSLIAALAKGGDHDH